MTVAAYRWTIDQYHQAVNAGVFEGQHIELLNGELVTMPSEGEVHAGRGDGIGTYLRHLLGNRALLRDSKPITLPESASEPEPDLAIVTFQVWGYEAHHPYPEDIFWLIELSNTSLKKDVEIKDKVYAAAGIQEYWVVNLPARRLVVFRDPLDGEYQSKQTYTTGIISPLAFSDLVVSIDILLGLDRWSP
ncbi:MAG: Uma2 family endonuclease [Alkalinema sp. RU_4_3]|nr:Uma2 family endonuclease [Alkalinema sp. RU_4_3]